MDFQVTKNNVRDIVSRLREAVGSQSLTRSKAFEVFAQTLGIKNWDTLSALLKREEAPAAPVFRLEAPVELFVEAFACDDNMQGPSWAKVTVTQQFLDEVLRLRGLCQSQGVDLVAKSRCPDKWDGEESLRLRGDDLYVTADSWWFRACPKHSDYAVETRNIDIDTLLSLLSGNGSGDGYLVRYQDKLFYEPCGNSVDFIQMLVDDGELDESFAQD
jgi:hypothetical protein